MEIIDIQLIDKIDIKDIPETLYKYRIWSDQYHKTILTERMIFMAPPTSFEDTKDCKLLKRFDLMTLGDIYQGYLNRSRGDNPQWTRQQHRAHARGWTKKSPLRDKAGTIAKQEQHFLEFDKRFGVLSLTADPSNLAMWNKYAGNGTGFCIGFHTKVLFAFLGGGGPVIYYDSLPDILHDDPLELEHAKQVYSKEERWSFEKEYRTHMFYPNPATINDRQIVLPAEAFKEIVFGWSTSGSAIKEMKACIETQGFDLELKIVQNIEGTLSINTL